MLKLAPSFRWKSGAKLLTSHAGYFVSFAAMFTIIAIFSFDVRFPGSPFDMYSESSPVSPT